MDFGYYSQFFHDGVIYRIDTTNSAITIEVESAELENIHNRDNLKLSSERTLFGRIHFEQPRSVTRNTQPIEVSLIVEGDYATIYDLEVTNDIATMQLLGRQRGPDKEPTPFATFVISAAKIWWENLPDLKASTI